MALVGVHSAVKALDIVGQPTDTGGGFLAVAGYVVTAVGAALVCRGLLSHRSSRRWPTRGGPDERVVVTISVQP